LRKDRAHVHLRQVQEAVRRSAAEVFAAYVDQSEAPHVPSPVDDVLPVVLPPGELPGRAILPDGAPLTADHGNHWPLYLLTADGSIARRRGELYNPRYS